MIMDFRAMLELEETPEILGKITESTETRTLTEIRDGQRPLTDVKETRGARDTEGFKGY